MIKLTRENFEQEILNSSNPCVVTFKSDGCHLCRGLTGVLSRLESKYNRNIKFAIIDSADDEGLSNIFEVEGVPTMFLFIGGDAQEIPYPDAPSLVTGYHEDDLQDYLQEAMISGRFPK
jgi:thioredoxin 1